VFILTNRNEIDSDNRLWLGEEPFRQDPNRSRSYFLDNRNNLRSVDLTQADQILPEETQSLLVVLHGFDQTFQKAVERIQLLKQLYQQEVLLITWPSHPSVSPFEGEVDKVIRYISNRGRSRAKRAAFFLPSVFEQLHLLKNRSKPNTSFNFLVHSMGNLVLQNFTLSGGEIPRELLDHIIIHQAEVKSSWHQHWVPHLRANKGIYVTINQNDQALCATEKFKEPRLGSSLPAKTAESVHYLDFTAFEKIDDSHVVWQDAAQTPSLQAVLSALFKGQSADLSNFPII